jgi:hypothetical protein
MTKSIQECRIVHACALQYCFWGNYVLLASEAAPAAVGSKTCFQRVIAEYYWMFSMFHETSVYEHDTCLHWIRLPVTCVLLFQMGYFQY